MIASLLCAKAGLAVAPLIVVAVAVAYLTSETLTAYVDARVGAAPGGGARPARPRIRRFPARPERIVQAESSVNGWFRPFGFILRG